VVIDIPGAGIAVVVGYLFTTQLLHTGVSTFRRPGAERVVGRREP